MCYPGKLQNTIFATTATDLSKKNSTFAEIMYKKNMEFSAQQLASLLNGTIEGDASVKVSNFSKIEEGKPSTLTFLSNPKYEQYIYTIKADIVLVNNDFKPKQAISATLIRVNDPYMALATLLKLSESHKQNPIGIDPLAFVSKTAKIGKNVSIGAFAYIGDNVTIGDDTCIYPNSYLGPDVSVGSNTIIYPNVSIYKECVIGNNCILHSSCVIGADGFGFARDESGKYVKMPQNGNVILEDDIEVGASTTIDRGSMGSTIISRGVKLDNQIQIAHNVEIGENTVMAACTGISGSTKIGKDCVFAGKIGSVGHISIADNVIIAGGSNLTKNITEKGTIHQGSPAIPIGKAKRCYAVYNNLPELQKTVYELQKEIKELKDLINNK